MLSSIRNFVLPVLFLCVFSSANESFYCDCNSEEANVFDIHICKRNCKQFNISSINDLQTYHFRAHCGHLKIPTESKIAFHKGIKIPGKGNCPEASFDLKIEKDNDCWELPGKNASCPQLSVMKELISANSFRDRETCRYTYTFNFKEPGKYTFGTEKKFTLLVQDSIININNSGHDFSVIYLKKEDNLHLKFKKDQLRNVELFNLKGKIMYSKALKDYPETTFKLDLKKIGGKKFMLSLRTEIKEMHKFIIME